MDSDKKNDSIYRIVFDQIDADGDGKLSKAEFKAVCKKKLPPEDHKLLKNKKYIDFDKLFGKANWWLSKHKKSTAIIRKKSMATVRIASTVSSTASQLVAHVCPGTDGCHSLKQLGCGHRQHQ